MSKREKKWITYNVLEMLAYRNYSIGKFRCLSLLLLLVFPFGCIYGVIPNLKVCCSNEESPVAQSNPPILKVHQNSCMDVVVLHRFSKEVEEDGKTITRNVLTQNMMNIENTKYVIKYDLVLVADIIVPANCILEFDGGSLGGNYILYGNKCKISGNPVWDKNIIYYDVFDNDGPYLNISKVTNITSFGNTSYTDVHVLDNLNSIIKDITDEYGEVFLVFENGVTYDFGQSILLRDNMTILGNGCTIKFHDVKNQNDDIVTMFNYNSFLTNRKYSRTGGIDSYTLLEQYASKNIVIKDIVFDSTDYIGNFWFNVDSPRGIISFEYIDNIKILNCSFIKVTEMPIWFGNSRNVEINGCDVSVSEKYGQTASGAGLLWTNNPHGNKIGISNVYILNNTIDNYGDEAISLFHITDGDFVIRNNSIYSKEGVSFWGGTDKTNILLENNIITPKKDGSDGNYVLVFESNENDYAINELSIVNNKFNHNCVSVLSTQLHTYYIKNLNVTGNTISSKLCDTSYICITDSSVIRNNMFSDGMWFSPNVSSGKKLVIDNNIVFYNQLLGNKISMFNSDTYITNNWFVGNITFISIGYKTSLFMENNFVCKSQIKLVKDKYNWLKGNVFVNSQINLSRNEDVILNDNKFFD